MENLSIIQDPNNHYINIKVSYYNEEEKTKLLRYPTSSQIQNLVSEGAKVKTAQFLTYYLFHKKRPGKPGYRSYTELGQKIHKSISDLEDYVYLQNGSLISAPDVIKQDGPIIERIGEAAALSIGNQIHNIHEADWDKIPEHPGRKGFKTFDYSHEQLSASDGKHIIQIEAKGTSITTTTTITQNVRNQKLDIDQKKKQISSRESLRTYKYPADIRYGMICAIGKDGPLHCWLVDPPGEEGFSPSRYRLLARLQFFFDWISFLSSRSQLSASLGTRLIALQNIVDPFELSDIPLIRGNGERFNIDAYLSGQNSGLSSHMCSVVGAPIVGTLLRISDRSLFFIGIQIYLFELAANQKFEEILRYRFTGGTRQSQVSCVIPRGRARTMEITHLDDGRYSDTAYIRFSAEGTLFSSEGGVVFGIVNAESDQSATKQ